MNALAMLNNKTVDNSCIISSLFRQLPHFRDTMKQTNKFKLILVAKDNTEGNEGIIQIYYLEQGGQEL